MGFLFCEDFFISAGSFNSRDENKLCLSDESDSERSALAESVRRIKQNDKSFARSKPACACVFTDHVETETARVVCFCVCSSRMHTWAMRACVSYMWIAVSHGHAVDFVSDSLVKFQ